MAVITATDETYDKLLSASEYAVVDYYGDHCGSCVYLEPFFREASNDMPLISFIKINVTHNPETRKRYQINGVPTIKFFHNGEEVHEAMGGMDTDHLEQHIAKMLYD
ncbi:MAG: thioredoxin family protein [Oscillospiraceae bacterium]|nr:thioredoxin family protein [Oscillospiraceae bacterium]